jgi:predicted transcriptional regulator
MTTKAQMLQAVENLPDDASVEDAINRLLLLAKVERGLQQVDAGQTISHEELKARFAKWLR